jgi:hypothetical protein
MVHLSAKHSPARVINTTRRSGMTSPTNSLEVTRRVAVVGAACALAVALSFSASAANAEDSKATAAQTTRTSAAKSAPRANSTSHADRVETRIRDLHSKLGITPAQEDRWNALAQVMRENAQNLDSIEQTRLDNASRMTAVEDVRSYSELADAHAQGLKNFVPAFQALYDSLSPAQQKNADQMFRGRMQAQAATRGSTKGS